MDDEPFVGEIRLFSFAFAPKGWSACDGQLLQIKDHQALYSVLGTAFGGDGRTTFALPNLQGRVPVHPDVGIKVGKTDGAESHILTISEMPSHTHQVRADKNKANSVFPIKADGSPNTWGASGTNPTFSSSAPDTQLHTSAIANAGGNQPHENMQPYLVVNYCIALIGIYPPRQ